MPIRYTCEKCGSVLKIKEALAGTDGRCPKCKTRFVVPQPAESNAAPDSESAPANDSESAPASDSESAPASDAEFDPVAFLMTDQKGAGAQAAGKSQKSAGAATSAEPDVRVARPKAPVTYTESDEPDVRVGGGRPRSIEADDSETPVPRKRKIRRAAEASAAASADEMLRVDASSNAKELLTKTMEESRIRAAQMPAEREKPGIDYSEIARELGLRVAPIAVGAVVLVILAYILGGYMTGGGPQLPDLAEVTGTVTKGGKPLPRATVSFNPVDVKASAATGISDENGYFEMEYIEGVKGAVIGKNRVEVSCIDANGREMVPPKTQYGWGSNVIHEVKEGSQTINIEIP